MNTYKLSGQRFHAEGLIPLPGSTTEKILLNPKLPEHFYNLAIEDRSDEELELWEGHPYIKSEANDAWPSGTIYKVHCLDGGARRRPTTWGWFNTLDEAVECVEEGPVWRRNEKLTLPYSCSACYRELETMPDGAPGSCRVCGPD